MSKRAFTLAEVLIALALLGAIAAFTIPKVLSNYNHVQRRSVYKETIAALFDIQRKLKYEQALGLGVYKKTFVNSFNALTACTNDAGTQGCWDKVVQGYCGGPPSCGGGVILHNGMTIAAIDDFPLPCSAPGTLVESLLLDWNGSGAPNQRGEDQAEIVYCVGDKPCDDTCSGVITGTIIPAGGIASDEDTPDYLEDVLLR